MPPKPKNEKPQSTFNKIDDLLVNSTSPPDETLSKAEKST